MAKYLKDIVKYMIDSLQSTEGIVVGRISVILEQIISESKSLVWPNLSLNTCLFQKISWHQFYAFYAILDVARENVAYLLVFGKCFDKLSNFTIILREMTLLQNLQMKIPPTLDHFL